MSTNTTKKRGTGAAAVIIVLCLIALGALGYVIYRQLYPAVPELVEMYVASDTEEAPAYGEDGTRIAAIMRGAAVRCVKEDIDGGAERIRVENGMSDGKVSYLYMDAGNLVADLSDTVSTETVYALRGMSLLDETGAVPGCAVEKGMALTVTGFDGMDGGKVVRWKVS